MNFVVYAKGLRSLSILQALLDEGLKPVAMVLEKSDENLEKLAKKSNIEFIISPHPKNKEHIAWLKRLKPDLLLAAGYGKILPGELLKIPAFGAINCHGGSLPFYRGTSPIPWQIIRGETEGEAYVLTMTEGIDDGYVLASEKYSIEPEETAKHITEKVNNIFISLVPKIIKQYSEGFLPELKPQPAGKACVWTFRYPHDGLIRWDNLNACEVVNLVRALDEPYPGAFTYCRGKKIIIKRAMLHPMRFCGVPGRFIGKREGYPTILARDRGVAIKIFSIDNCPDMPFPAKYGDDMQYTCED